CAAACRTDDDCAGAGIGVFCAVDRAPGGARLACSAVPSAGGFEGDPCTTDRECVSDLCLSHVCHEGCTADAQCAMGSRCLPQTIAGGTVTVCGYAPITGVTVEDYTVFNESQAVDRGAQRMFVVPDDMVSITFVAQDMVGSDLYAAIPQLIAPDGTSWIDSATWNGIADQPVREWFGERQVNSALAPSSDTLRVQSGQYSVGYTLFNDSTTHVSMRQTRGLVRVKRAPGGVLPATGTLHMRIFLVGLAGLNAGNAGSNATLQNALRTMGTIYAQVGINVVVDGYADVSGTDASTYSVIDSEAELEQLLTRSASSTGDVLNLFFVRSVSMSAGLEGAIGVAGDIVGPPGIHGTIHSGVVVGWESTAGFGAAVTAQTMSHECAHYLGLWHPQESQTGCTTVLAATCSPFRGVDPITDTPSGRGANPYLMNWFTSNGSNIDLSPGEGIVMRSYPIVR
ncbi:MAG: hypothetical protein WCJ30_20235, partial [Deltaproteobacteria bacterium]